MGRRSGPDVAKMRGPAARNTDVAVRGWTKVLTTYSAVSSVALVVELAMIGVLSEVTWLATAGRRARKQFEARAARTPASNYTP